MASLLVASEIAPSPAARLFLGLSALVGGGFSLYTGMGLGVELLSASVAAWLLRRPASR